MGKLISGPKKMWEDVKAAIAFDQPKLSAAREGSYIVIKGSFLLFENDVIANPAGPISEYDIEIVLSKGFPIREPKVFEVGDKILRCAERHINGDGACCVTVWENWLVCAEDNSFSAFLSGPLREYFLSQYKFERTGEWPFGERPHEGIGLREAYADALGIPNKKKSLIYHLRLLSKAWPKGHWRCPCGSEKRLRHCHKDRLMRLHEKVPPHIAIIMLRRLRSFEKKVK